MYRLGVVKGEFAKVVDHIEIVEGFAVAVIAPGYRTGNDVDGQQLMEAGEFLFLEDPEDHGSPLRQSGGRT